jgi:hypothetical protein
MKHLKRLMLSFFLMSAVTVVALAGDPNGPSCVPGQTDTPPCSSQSVTVDSTEPGDMNTPPSNEVDLTTVVEVVQLALSLF